MIQSRIFWERSGGARVPRKSDTRFQRRRLNHLTGTPLAERMMQCCGEASRERAMSGGGHNDMDWRATQADSRNRYLAKFDVAEVDRYDASVGRLSDQDEDAYLSDLSGVLQFREGTSVLDAGAGTGALCGLLSRLPGLAITAMEPVP